MVNGKMGKKRVKGSSQKKNIVMKFLQNAQISLKINTLYNKVFGKMGNMSNGYQLKQIKILWLSNNQYF